MIVLQRALLVIVVSTALSSVPLAATAQDKTQDQLNREQLDECIGNRVYPDGRAPSCTFDSEGNLIDRDFPDRVDPSSSLAGWVVFALLWSAAPMVIGASVAASRGQHVGMALLLTLFFGWLGLAVVVFLQKPKTIDVATGFAQRLTEPRVDVADQIRKLGELRKEGLLTEEEFRTKKAQLLGAS